MARKRVGSAKHTHTTVLYGVECPIHSMETRIEYPVGQKVTTSGHIESMAGGFFFCPSGDGHTFPMTEAKCVTYDTAGNITASGLALLDIVEF